MKRFLFIISLLLFCTFEMVQSQSVFPTKNARWEVLVPAPYYRPFDPPFLTGTEKGNAALIYTIGEDSIIGVNDKVYYNLYIDNLYAGSLRVDDKRVWITADEGNHETLLYDFGVKEGDVIKQEHLSYLRETPFSKEHPLVIGDTILLWYNEVWDEETISVDRVSEGVYGKEIMVWRTYSSDYHVWCEGLGSLYGMFLAAMVTTNGDMSHRGCLWKLIKDGDRVYPEQDLGSIEEQLTNENLNISSIENLFFYPATIYYDKLARTVRFINIDLEDNYLLKVSSLSGYDVFETELSSSKSVVDLSSLPLGWYVCTLIKQGQVIAVKKINR